MTSSASAQVDHYSLSIPYTFQFYIQSLFNGDFLLLLFFVCSGSGLAAKTDIVGPAGLLMIYSGYFLVDGVTIDSCGLGNGNIVLYGHGWAEINNIISKDARTRG